MDIRGEPSEKVEGGKEKEKRGLKTEILSFKERIGSCYKRKANFPFMGEQDKKPGLRRGERGGNILKKEDRYGQNMGTKFGIKLHLQVSNDSGRLPSACGLTKSTRETDAPQSGKPVCRRGRRTHKSWKGTIQTTEEETLGGKPKRQVLGNKWSEIEGV